jgi:hypothetical protein
VCGRIGTACNVHLQRGLRVNIDNDYWVCDYYGYLLDDWLRRGPSVRRRGSAAGCVYLQRGLRFDINDDDCVCDYHWLVFVVHRGPQLRWWFWATDSLHL